MHDQKSQVENQKSEIPGLLSPFPVVVEIPIAWGEMDSFQHVNNIVYLRYFETARIAYFERLSLMQVRDETGIGPILASVSCQFRIPLTYPDVVSVGTRISNLGEDRFTMEFAIVSREHHKVAAQGDGVVVSYNYRAKKKTTIPQIWRDRISALQPGI
jgi:acyl-CoA thioester hydrolase